MENLYENTGRKRARVDSDEKRVDSDSNFFPITKRVQDESNDKNSSDSTRISSDILNILDEPEPETEAGVGPASEDLEIVMRSFEEEITIIQPFGSQSDLGYLLEASDDELGLPPSVSSGEEQMKRDIENMGSYNSVNNEFEFVFENDLVDFPEFLYQPESLHAR